MKEPELQDYGITRKLHDLYHSSELWSSGQTGPTIAMAWVATFFAVFGVISAITEDWFRAIVGAFLIGILGWIPVAFIIHPAVLQFRKFLLFRSGLPARIKLYEEAIKHYRVIKEDAETAQQEAEKIRLRDERLILEARRARQEAEQAKRRTLKEFWMSLSGVAFERELAMLFRRLGYTVSSTPLSGDQGVDLILMKDGITTIVQCKGYKDPAGPAVARELLGSLAHTRANNAILACTGGFTQGVFDFVRGKPITLISASDLVAIAENVDQSMEGGI